MRRRRSRRGYRRSLIARKRRSRKKRYLRRSRRRAGFLRLKAPSGWPNRVRVKLNYFDAGPYITVDYPNYSESAYQFRANSVYDPDYALGGHQLMGFDQWAALYNHYRVISSKITVRFIPDPGYDFLGCIGIAVCDNASIPGHVGLVEGQKNYRWRNITSTTGDTRIWKVSKTYSAKKYFGPRALVQNQYATVATNPTEDVLFTIIGYRRWVGQLATVIICQTKITYYVEFCEPKAILPSS